SIPSETACYPAKISHGHIMDLIEKGIKFIFYPSIFYDRKEDKEADNHVNCPVVIGYPDVLKLNIEQLKDITFIHPFLSFDDKEGLKGRLFDELRIFNISKDEIKAAVDKAWAEQMNFKKDIQQKGEEVLQYIEEKGIKGI